MHAVMVSTKITVITVLSALFWAVSYGDYEACSGVLNEHQTENNAEDNIDNHVGRLMELRREGYGWMNTPEVALSIQLTKPSSFIAINKTIDKLWNELRERLNNISLAHLSQYILAIKSTCLDPSNFRDQELLLALREKMNHEFYYGGVVRKTPRNGWYGFFLALGTYCVTHGDSPSPFYVRRVLHAQHQDGSFGRHQSTDMTSQAMLSLECLNRKNLLSSRQERQVRSAMRKATEFLRSRIVTDRNLVWISDKYSSPSAVMAMKESGIATKDDWNCKLIMDSLNGPVKPNELESAIAQRLMTLKGVSYLSLLDDNYRCINPDSSPTDYSPDYDPVKPGCSENNTNDWYRNLFSPVLIDVYISVHKHTLYDGDVTDDVTITDIEKGKTLFEILTIAQCRGLMTFESKTSSWGEFITTVNGIEAQSEEREYWSIRNNGLDVNVGVSQLKPSHADHIIFKLKKW